MGRKYLGAEHAVTVRGVKGTTFKSRPRVRVELNTLLIRVFCLSSWMSRGVVFAPIRSLRPLRAGGPVEPMRPVSPCSTSCLWSACASGVPNREELSRGVGARGGMRPANVPFNVNGVTAICRSRGELTASRNTPISTTPRPGAAEAGCLEDVGMVEQNPRMDVMCSSFSNFRAIALMTFAGSLASSLTVLPARLFCREGTATPRGGTALIWGAS
jgi:hypothetical protein